MQRKLSLALVSLATLAAALPATAAADYILPKLTDMSVSPGCVRPGGQVHAVLRVWNGSAPSWTYRFAASYFGAQVGDSGVRNAPAADSYTQVDVPYDAPVPVFAPWGPYQITGTVYDYGNPQYGGQSRTATVWVSPLC
jgi:hypothetical protein